MNKYTKRLGFHAFFLGVAVFTFFISFQRADAATSRFNMTAAPATVSGWINVAGDPATSVPSATDPSTGIGLRSAGTAKWNHSYGGTNAFNGAGQTVDDGGGFAMPAGVTANYWYNYDDIFSSSKYQAQLFGLNVNKLYTITIIGSRNNSNGATPPRIADYNIKGSTALPVQSLDVWQNTSRTVVFSHVKPATGGIINIAINKKANNTGGPFGYLNGLTITEETSTNSAPTANAGSDQTITLPTNSVTVSGSGTDTDGSIASYAWTKISGTGGSIASPSAAATAITGLAQGTYVFRLTVTDNQGATGSDDVTIVVNSSTNQSPSANAGTDQTITLPTNSVSLSGSGTDTDGTIASYAWSKVSGGAASIANASSAATAVTDLVQGSYVFRLTVTDNLGATASDTVAITVNAAPNQAPTANAGVDQTIALPTHSIVLAGMGTDSDGTISSYAWTEISSGASNITSPAAATTAVSDLGPGIYTFRLTVTDNLGAAASDTVTVTVNPENTAACSAQKIVVLGSSTSAGYGLNPVSNSYVNRYASYISGVNASTVTNLAVGGYSTYEILPTGTATPSNRPAPDPAHNITAALSQHPSAIILNLPSNDVGNGFSTAETEANFQTISAAAAAAGVPMWITTTQPRNFDQTGINQQIQQRDWITATFGSHVIDFWSVVANANGTINATYGQGDGIHLNALGHQVLFNRVAGVGLLTELCGQTQQVPPENQTPTAMASLSSVTLSGSGTDSDGTIASYAWTKVSGGSASITTPAAATTTVTGLAAGTYVFRLTITDDQGATDAHDVQFSIN